MKHAAIALMVGVTVTVATVGLVLLAGERMRAETQTRERVVAPIVIAPTPPRTESELSSFASEQIEQTTRPLEPDLTPEPTAVAGLTDVHAGARLGARLPRLAIGASLDARKKSNTPDTHARPLTRPSPRYPAAARRSRTEGFVRVRLRVDTSGRVVDAVVVEADPEGVFEDVALAAARRYRFEPARIQGLATEDTIEQRIVFRLQ